METFDSLNVESRWTHDIYIAQEPVYNPYKKRNKFKIFKTYKLQFFGYCGKWKEFVGYIL